MPYNQYNPSDIYKKGGGSAAGVQSIQAGAGISVDDTTPSSPIVSANLAAGAGIQINGIPESNALEIECTVTPGNTIESVLHGVAKKTDGMAVDLAGIQNLITTEGSISIGADNVVLNFTGESGGNINISALHEMFVVNWGLSSGVPFIVMNKGTSACDVIDYDDPTYRQINGADALTVRPGEAAFIWLKTASTWAAQIVSNIRTISGGNGINVQQQGGGNVEVSATGVFESDYGVQSLPIAACRNAAGIPGVNNGGALLGTYTIVPASFSCTSLQCWIKQTGGGSCVMAVYSEAGALLGYTAPFSPSVVGKKSMAIAFGPSGISIDHIDLTGGEAYYFALWGNQDANGAQFYGTDVAMTFGPSPYLGWTMDNIAALPAAISGGYESSQRFYIMASA